MTTDPLALAALAFPLMELSKSENISDAAFADAVYQAVTQGLDRDAFQDNSDIGQGTLERWMQGANLPPQSVRKKVLEVMAATFMAAIAPGAPLKTPESP